MGFLQKETQRLVRAGIPNEVRRDVWKLLINQQVYDLKDRYGKYYYQNLCNNKGTKAENLVFNTFLLQKLSFCSFLR